MRYLLGAVDAPCFGWFVLCLFHVRRWVGTQKSSRKRKPAAPAVQANGGVRRRRAKSRATPTRTTTIPDVQQPLAHSGTNPTNSELAASHSDEEIQRPPPLANAPDVQQPLVDSGTNDSNFEETASHSRQWR